MFRFRRTADSRDGDLRRPTIGSTGARAAELAGSFGVLARARSTGTFGRLREISDKDN